MREKIEWAGTLDNLLSWLLIVEFLCVWLIKLYSEYISLVCNWQNMRTWNFYKTASFQEIIVFFNDFCTMTKQFKSQMSGCSVDSYKN